ncbi:hypothetical protein L9F63_013287, partial [Diploptera punctata]
SFILRMKNMGTSILRALNIFGSFRLQCYLFERMKSNSFHYFYLNVDQTLRNSSWQYHKFKLIVGLVGESLRYESYIALCVLERFSNRNLKVSCLPPSMCLRTKLSIFPVKMSICFFTDQTLKIPSQYQTRKIGNFVKRLRIKHLDTDYTLQLPKHSNNLKK